MLRRLVVSFLMPTALMTTAAWAASPFAGRWDITVKSADATYPDWLEVVEKDGAATARVQPRTGSVRPVKIVSNEGGKMVLQISAANKKNPETTWELSASGGKIGGTESHGGAKFAELAGVK